MALPGEGAYSVVYRVRRLSDGQEYALKKVKMIKLITEHPIGKIWKDGEWTCEAYNIEFVTGYGIFISRLLVSTFRLSAPDQFLLFEFWRYLQ